MSDQPASWDDAMFPPTAPADPDVACEHPQFSALANVGRLAASDDDPTVVGYVVELQVRCAACNEPFRFIGLPAGMLPNRPTVNVTEDELRCPIRPASSDPDFGLGTPGFAVTYTERDAR